jgi:hypothetical protein
MRWHKPAGERHPSALGSFVPTVRDSPAGGLDGVSEVHRAIGLDRTSVRGSATIRDPSVVPELGTDPGEANDRDSTSGQGLAGDPSPKDDPGRAGAPDPFDDADALAELEHEITVLAAHLHAAEHRFLTLIAEFDRREGWKIGGHRNCTDWLHVATGLDRGAAGERVRTARALHKVPQISAAMGRGELSFSKVRARRRRSGGREQA